MEKLSHNRLIDMPTHGRAGGATSPTVSPAQMGKDKHMISDNTRAFIIIALAVIVALQAAATAEVMWTEYNARILEVEE